VFPNFQVFNLADQIGIGQGIDPLVFVRVSAYALIYIAVFGGLAVYSFSKREI
jgi:ABC-type transport system involved in multi-copper enzyme maturation permease subunit